MITTITLNPAIDKTINLKELKPGKINRVKEISTSPGGKGINVARVLNKLGNDVQAMGFLGGGIGEDIERHLEHEEINCDFVCSQFSTRENLKIIELSNSCETEINEFGQVEEGIFDELTERLKKILPDTSYLVMGGSLPRGLRKDSYYKLIQLADEYDVRTILDTSGDILKTSLEGSPYLVKPNINEVEELFDLNISDDSDLHLAIDNLQEYGVEIVVISLGSNGAVFAGGDKRIKVKPPEVNVKQNTVGAGDTMVAGICYGLENDLNLKEFAVFSSVLATRYIQTGTISELSFESIQDIIENTVVNKLGG